MFFVISNSVYRTILQLGRDTVNSIERMVVAILYSLLVLFTLIDSEGTKAAAVVIENLDETELLVEYKDAHQMFSENQTIAGVKSREEIAPQVELWSLADNADMKQVLEQLQEDSSILHAEPNYERQLFAEGIDTYLDNQWWIPSVRPKAIWSMVGSQKKDIVVAVIDSGIAERHEDLQGRIQPGGYNFYNNSTNLYDENGHGTMVSGVVAATAGNNLGISGITGAYKVKVLPLKVTGVSGTMLVSNVIKAIDYAIMKDVDVINLSLGSSKFSTFENAAVQRAIDSGISVIAAAGNDALVGNYINYPASYQNVISVGAIDQQNNRSSFSSYNPYVSLVAPGTNIFTTKPSNGYAAVDGTSFSTPIVAGAVAMVKSLKPEISPEQMKKLLEDAAEDLGIPGKDSHYGAGLLNLEKLSSKIAPSKGHIAVESIELNRETLTMKLAGTTKSTGILSRGIEELELMHTQSAIDFENEPNDSFSTSSRLTPGNGMVGSITNNYFDIDHYQFELESPGKFSLLGAWVKSPYINHRDNMYLRIGIYNVQQQLIDVAELATLSNGEWAMYYSSELPKGKYYLVVLQSSPYQYLFTNERYMITSLFTPTKVQPPTPELTPVFLFNEELLEVGDSKTYVSNIELTGKVYTSNPEVAIIDSAGNVHAVGHGTATIHYISKTVNKEAKVKVSRKSAEVKAALFEKIYPVNATNQNVTWTSSNPSVAEVDNHGIIIGKKAGFATISVKTTDGDFTASTIVTVIGDEEVPEFVGDFPAMNVSQNKVFTVTFNQELEVGKDYTQDIRISCFPDGGKQITTFSATVDVGTPTKLHIKPNVEWDEGIYYLTINKKTRNRNSVELSKDVRMKFDVQGNFGQLDKNEKKSYQKLLEALN